MSIYRVLQVGMTENIGGMETYLMEQYRHLDRQIIRYDFINITADRPMVYTEEIQAQGDNVYHICRRSKNPLRHYWEWICFLRKYGHKYDAITLNACHLYYVYPLVIARLMGLRKRILHSHNTGNEINVGILRKIIVKVNTWLFHWAATDYWACSETAGQWMFGQRPFQVIHNSIDVEKFSFNPALRQKKRDEMGLSGKFVLGHVGRFTYQKNHDFLIDIFIEVFRREPKAVLLLIGDAVGDDTYLKYAQKKVKKNGLSNHVRFLGLRKDVPALMQAMDAFLLPSHFEGLPLVGIEAQGTGIPCFFSNTITPELAMTSLAHFYPLENAEIWAKEILSRQNLCRMSQSEILLEHGYDICHEIKKVERLYLTDKCK